MSLKIAVCIKPVPDPECYDRITIDPIKKTLVRKDIPSVISSADKHALELAVQMRERHDGSISVFSMAPPEARAQLLEALAFGADDAYLLSDRRVGGADTLATSYALSALIQHVGHYDMILLGNESDDGATAHVPSQLGEWMSLPHMTDAVGVRVESDSAVLVDKEFETGIARYRVQLPCVIAVRKTINDVRYIPVKNFFAAKRKPLTVLGADDLALDNAYIGLNGSPTKPGELITPQYSRNTVPIEGTDEEIAQAIIDKIKIYM